MPRSPSKSRSRSPVKRRRQSASAEPENACPFLIRLFVTKGRHTPMMEFEEGRLPIQDEFTAYGWKHSTPSSLIQLLLPSFPALYRSPFARYSFRHIYVDASPRGLYRTKDLVSFTGRDLMDTVAGSTSDGPEGKSSGGRNGLDVEMELDDVGGRGRVKEGGKKIEEKTLGAYGFETGDLISVSLHIPEPRGALRRPTMGGPGGPGGPGGMGMGGSGPGTDRGSFGWDSRNANSGGAPGSMGGSGTGAGMSAQADRTDAWERGAPLPDQSSSRPTDGRTHFGGVDGKEGAGPGGRWGRGGGQAGGPPPRGGGGGGGGGGMGIRGTGRRSRSPDYTAGARRDAGPDERGGRGGRSRSPYSRRERGGRR